MKKLWKKIKHWLIRKLGGYIAPTQELKVTHVEYPTIKYQSSVTLRAWEREHRPDIIKHELAEDITEAILNEMTIREDENYERGTITYLAEIEIVKRS